MHVDTEFSVERTKSMVLPWGQRGVILVGDSTLCEPILAPLVQRMN